MYERKDMLTMDRPPSGRISMDRKRRAKQFAPFQALHGFGGSIAEKEVLYVTRRAQSDSMRSELDQKIARLPCGSMAKVTYYLESSTQRGFGLYLSVYGIPRIIPHLKIMQIGGMEIAIDDIAEIEAVSEEDDCITAVP